MLTHRYELNEYNKAEFLNIFNSLYGLKFNHL